jgi:predicted DNA-binding WGR domain protein
MRRFELVEGASSKFWEIESQGTGFTVRWGRIGTDGQTQHKSFPTEEKAQAEQGKLIAEKQKKGYAEVGGAARAGTAVQKAKAAAPPPIPAAPVPPTPAADPDAPIAWAEALLRRVYPRRGGVAVAVRPLPTVKKSWALVREDFLARVAGQAPQDTHENNLTAQTQAVVERIRRTEPSLGTPEEDAVLVIFLQYQESWNKVPRVEPIIDLLFALGGPVHATRAALLSLDLYLAGEPALQARRGSNTNPHHQHYNLLSRGHLRGLPRLRALLATQTDDEGYQAARDAAALLRDSAERRAASAFLFPTETAWVRAQAEEFVAAPEPGFPFILSSVSEPDTLALLIPHVDVWNLMHEPNGHLASLLDGLGVHGLALLRELQPKLSGADAVRAWAEVTASLNSDAAMECLLEGEKDALPFLIDAAMRWPHRALRLLTPRATLRGKEGELARAILTHLLRREPAAVRAALPSLSDEAREVMARLQSQSGPDVPDAPPEQLPPVLVSPPWRSSQKPEALPVLDGVVPPALPDALVWREGEQAEWSRRKGWEYKPYGSTPQEQELLSGKVDLARAHERLDIRFFAHAPEALALEYLGKLQPTRYEEDWLPPIIARLGLAVLPAIVDYVTTHGAETYALLAPFAVTSLAPQVAEAFHRTKKARPTARTWLLRHPEHATAGLLVPALGKPGKAKDAACAALRMLASNGQEATVLDVAGRVSPPAREAVRRILAFDPLNLFPAKLPPVPETLGIEGLPRPLLQDRSAKLPIQAVREFATLLSFCTLEEPYAGLAQVKAACDPASLARFAWGLFEAWMTVGAPSKESWAFQALGLLGDDDSARKLAPLIRQWPGEAAHARAVMGLEVLATLGTDVTLIYLNGIAEKVKFKGLQQKAQEKIEQIAEARGLTRQELADRLVPDLGLDDTGSLTLDFGERTFTVGFDEQLKPFVRDASGTRLKDLPKPNQKDDAEKAGAASEQWKALKKDAKTAAGIQILRLELAMCARRRWSTETFRRFFVEHPLLIHVVRRLVWGTYSPEGALQDTFRVAEDRTFADLNEDTWTLPDDALVGLPHALELDAKTAGAWGQILADYQLLQPFAQLGRPTHTPGPAEREATKLERVKGLKVPTGKVLGLEARGWRRGAPQDGGVTCWMEKPLSAGWEAHLDLEPGLFTGMLSESPEQQLGDVVMRQANTWGSADLQPWGTLDAILFSELVRDLEGLRPA